MGIGHSYNALFQRKEDMRKDSLAKIPGLLDALLQVIDDWRNIALPADLIRTHRVRTLGANSMVADLIRTHRVRTLEDEELVTNALETIVNLASLLDLRIFSSAKPSYIKITPAIMGMLGSTTKAWHCAAAELLGWMIINPDNELFLLPFVPQMHKRLVDLMSIQALDAQAAAVGAEVNMDCRLKLASERWAVDRLLKVIKTPHPVPEVCRKAAMILESLVSEPQNRALLLTYENAFADILFSDSRYSDTFGRILYELTSRPNNKFTAARGVWGM
ncbi:hypothetical protein GH714_003959 [Hevea brasiliensis]|uniref:Uncharacterized protein n=1 Tax=Hevea brasiliensis TaxID=3981 RepID=A0A6A6KQI1_HEVBR|nr:hypothetical protein GH714_003959 [Hevea brasiliensis]